MFHDFYAACNTSEVIISKQQIFVHLSWYESYSTPLSLPPPQDVMTGQNKK